MDFRQVYTPYPTQLPILPEKDAQKGKRRALNPIEYERLLNTLTDGARLLLQVVYLSGMRPSEVCKLSIKTIDDIKVFDLSDSNIQLKTASSHRLIPIHNNLLPYIEEIQALTYNDVKWFSVLVNRELKHLEDVSLYSARHTAITTLINKQVPPERVRALVGHTNSSTTFNVYFKGYEMDILQADINLL